MANNSADFLGDSLAAPLGNLIAAIGEGVGEAQAALDQGSLQQTIDLYSETGQTDALRDLLKEVGYQPTFYTIPEVKVKAKVSLALTQSSIQNNTNSGPQRLSKMKVYGTPMNASITNRYNANLNASAELEFTIKPVPPIIEARVAPDLVNKTFEEATQLLATLSLNYSTQGDGIQPTDLVISQQPAKNSPMRLGDTVELNFIAPDLS